MSMSIGELKDNLKRADQSIPVLFAFGGCVPTTVESWRGVYAEPALGFAGGDYANDKYPTVADLLAELEKATSGEIYHGWKGGEYTYRDSDILHIDNRGCWTSTELCRVQVSEYNVILHTAREE